MNTVILLSIVMNTLVSQDISRILDSPCWSNSQCDDMAMFETTCVSLSKYPSEKLRPGIVRYLKEDMKLKLKNEGNSSKEIQMKLGMTRQVRAANIAVLTRIKFFDDFGKVDARKFGPCIFAIEPNPWEKTKLGFRLSNPPIIDYYGTVFDALGEFDAYSSLSNKQAN